MPSTSPSGIVYPSSSDAPRVWEDMQDLADSVQTALTAMGTWTTYTPTFAAGVTAVGTGAVREGWYCQIGKIVHWGGRIQFGTSPTINATIQMDMPVQAHVGGGNGLTNSLGAWQFRDDSVTFHYAGTVAIYSSGGVVASFNGAWDSTAPRNRLGAASTPAASVAANDILTWSGTYRAA